MTRAVDYREKCARCAFLLEPGADHPKTDRVYYTPVCIHERVVNWMGVLSLGMARGDASPCGPEARLFKP